MSSSAPLADTQPPAVPSDDPPAQDHWRGGLPALRAELDRIDNALHDLLMQRASVVEHVARSGKPAAFRPGREARIIIRLLARHTGHLPRQAIFRIWRELLAGTTAMQGPFSMAVCETDPGGAMTQLAREHFGALTPLRAYGSPGQALTEISNGSANVAVLPFPTEADGWWTTLSQREPRIHVIARLPFWTQRTEGAPTAQALVVAAFAPDPSDQDRSLLALELDADVSRTRLAAELTAAGLPAGTMVLRRNPGAAHAQVLVEVEGFVADDDARLGTVPRRPVVLGGYAVPLAGGGA
jgi:chorismate mutase / prephenate dehydratase